MHKLLLLIFVISISVLSVGFYPVGKIETYENIAVQKTDTLNWKLLGIIRFVKKQHPEYGEVNYPQVNEKLKSLHKKKVAMTGYIVPIDNQNYALSKNVFASCFFCGKAGPETIIGLKFKNPKRYKTDQYVTVTGTFKVNEKDVDDWIYNMEDVVVIKGD
jgi:hypothetical protein